MGFLRLVSHIRTTPAFVAVLLSLASTAGAVAFVVASLLSWGESEVALPLWGIAGSLTVLQLLLVCCWREVRRGRAVLVSIGLAFGVAAVIAVLAYVHTIEW